MATKKKTEIENIPEEVFSPENLEEKLPEEISIEEPIFIPDIPAQMDDSIPETLKGESEKEFLTRLLNIQHEGGFGRHLDAIIYDRIKTLK